MYDKNILNKIKNISSCYEESECNTNFCLKNEKSCMLVIPINNLLTNVSNEELYYTKIADEFIRFNSFQKYIFEDKMILLNNSNFIIYL